jgi:hypothetical protein
MDTFLKIFKVNTKMISKNSKTKNIATGVGIKFKPLINDMIKVKSPP